jgi:hypothetical protein
MVTREKLKNFSAPRNPSWLQIRRPSWRLLAWPQKLRRTVIIAQIIDEISYLRKILSTDSVILLGPALVSARMSERTTSTAYGPLKKRRASDHVFALFALAALHPRTWTRLIKAAA